MQTSKEDRQAEVPESVRAIQPKKGVAARVFGAFKRNPGNLVIAGCLCIGISWVGTGIYLDRVEENRGYESGKSELFLKMERLEGEKGVEKLEETLEILEEKVDPRGWVNINSRLDALEALKEIVWADNFDSSRLALIDAMAIERSRMCSAEEPLLGEGAENALSEIRGMFKDPAFRPILGYLALEEAKKTGASAIWYLKLFMKYPKVSPTTVLLSIGKYGEGAPDVLGGLESLLSNPNLRNARDEESLASGVQGMLYTASRVSGENSEDVKKVLVSYFANPNFSRGEMYHEERAEEICGIISNALGEEFRGISAMDALLALNKNPNFKIDMLDGKLIANMQKTLRSIDKYNTNARKEAFCSLLQSPAFLPKMLDPKDLRGMLCIMRLAGDRGSEISTGSLQAVSRFANSRYAVGVAETPGITQKEKEELIANMWKTYRIVINRVGDAWDALDLASFCDRFPAECRHVFEESCKKPGDRCRRAANAIKQILPLYRQQENAHFLPLLEDLANGKRKNSPGQSEEAALSSIRNLGPQEEFERSYSDARKLSEEFGISASVAVCLNISYAIRTIGVEKARRLNREYGIEYFTRYKDSVGNYFLDSAPGGPKNFLELLSANAENRQMNGKPVLLFAYAKSDWNDAFSESSRYWLGAAARKYDIVSIEAKNEREFYRRVAFVAEKHGKISVLILNGHGNNNEVSLGDEGGEQGSLDVYDGEEMDALRGYFAPRPILILNSCSTGTTRYGIGAAISRALRGTAFAPSVDAGAEKIIVNYDGSILGAEYYWESESEGRKNTRVFDSGKMLPPSK